MTNTDTLKVKIKDLVDKYNLITKEIKKESKRLKNERNKKKSK